jgi:hypothetical protein
VAKHFWDLNAANPDMPDLLIVTSTDEGDQLALGNGPVTYCITGPSEELAPVLDGSLMLIAALSAGNCPFRVCGANCP